MKKFVVISLTILMLLFCITTVYANNNIKLEVSKTELNLGDEFVVSVNFNNSNNNSSVYAYTAKLSYNKDVFEVIEKYDFEEQESWSNITYNDSNNKFALINKTGDLTNKILNIKFKVKQDAKPGETSINISSASSSDGKTKTLLDGAEAKVTVIKEGLAEGESLPTVTNEEEVKNEDISVQVEKREFSWIPILCIVVSLIIALILTRILILSNLDKKSKTIVTVIGVIIIIVLLSIGFINLFKKDVDINNDEVVNYDDSNELMEYLLEIKKPENNKKSKIDVNKDGKVDIIDVASTTRETGRQNYEATVNASTTSTQGTSSSAQSSGNASTGNTPEVSYSSNVDKSTANNMPKKGEDILLDLYIDITPYTKVKSVKINGIDYIVSKVGNEKNHYQVVLKAQNSAGIQDFNISEVKLDNGKVVKTEYTVKVDVLKDKPKVDNFKIDDKKPIPEISFDLSDIDGAYKNSKFFITDSNGKVIFESGNDEIKIGHNVFYVELQEGQSYHYDFLITYDLDHNYMGENNNDIEEDYIDGIFSNADGNLVFNRQYGFTSKEMTLTPKVSNNDKLILSFENATESFYDVQSVIVDGTEYKVIKENEKYVVELPKGAKGLNSITVEKVKLQNGYEVEINQKLEYIYIKDIPSIDNIDAELKDGTVHVNTNVTDNDSAISKVEVKIKDEAGNIVKTQIIEKDINDENKYSGDVKLDSPGKYTVEVEITYDIGNGEEKALKEYSGVITEPISSSFTTEKCIIPKYALKGEYIEVFYSILDNTDEDVTNILVNGVKLPVEKVDNENYKVRFNCPVERANNGIFDVKATKIYYNSEPEGIESLCELQVEILKSEPIVYDLTIDDSEVSNGGKPKLHLSILDDDNTFITGTIVITNQNNGNTQNITIEKNKSTYELDNIEQFVNYNVAINLKYDLDNDQSNGENENTKTFLTHDFNIQKDYNFILNNVKFDEPKDGKVILQFSSTNISGNNVEKVIIGFNGEKHEYGVTKLNDSNYQVEIPLTDLNGNRTELTLEEVILGNLKVFNKDTDNEDFANLNSLVVYKNKPTATIGNVSVSDDKTSIKISNIEITDSDSTITKKALVLKLNGETVDKIEISNEKEIAFISKNNEAFAEGNYTVEILADYNLCDGNSYTEKIISNSKEVNVNIFAKVLKVSELIYANKHSQAVVVFNIKANTVKEITDIKINNEKPVSFVKNSDGTYGITLITPNKSGITDYKITEITFNNENTISIDDSEANQIYVLKDMPKVTNNVFDDEAEPHTYKFNFEDSENTLINGKIVISDLNGNNTEQDLVIGENTVNLLTLTPENPVTVKLVGKFDLDNDKNDNINQHDLFEVFSDTELKIIKYEISINDLQIKEINKESSTVTIDFNAITNNEYDITDIIIGNEFYSVTKNGDRYEVTIPYKQNNNDKVEITINEVKVSNGKVVNLTQPASFTILKKAPNSSKPTIFIEENKVKTTFEITDFDNTILPDGLRAELRDENNTLVDYKKITASDKEVTFDYDKAGTFKVLIVATYDVVDKENHTNVTIGESDYATRDIKTEINSSEIPQYGVKGQPIDLKYTLTDNTDKSITAFTINDQKITDITKLDDNNYIVRYNAPETFGKFDITVSKVYYDETEVTINPKTDSSYALKSKLTIKDLAVNTDGEKPVATYDLVDTDNSFVDGKLIVTDISTNEQITIDVTKAKNSYELDLKELSKYKIELKVNYDLDDNYQNNLNQSEEYLGPVEVEYIKNYNLSITDLTVLNVDRTALKAKLQFKSTNVSSYGAMSVLVENVSYHAERVEGTLDTYTFEYNIKEDELDRRKEVTISEVTLENAKKLEVQNGPKTLIFKAFPIIDNLELSTIENSKIKATFDVTDNDVTLKYIYAVLKDEDGNVISERTLEPNLREVVFDTIEAKKYKVELTGDFELVDGLTHSKEKFIESENSIEIIPAGEIKTVSISNNYPQKGETLEIVYQLLTNVSSNPTKLIINDNSEYELVNTETPGNYKIMYKVSDYATLENINVNRVFFENGKVIELAEPHNDKVEVLKSVPTVNISSTDLLQQSSVLFNINVNDPDNAMTSGKASIHDQELILNNGSNTFNVNVNPDEEHTLQVELNYDLDNNELTKDTDRNDNVSRIMVTKNFILVSNYKLTISDLQTFRKEPTLEALLEFNKKEQIQLRFNSSNSTTFIPEKVVINDIANEEFTGTEYDVKKVEDGSSNHQYYVDLVTDINPGIQEFRIDSVKLSSSNLINNFEGEKPTAKIEVLKDKPTMTNYTSTNHENSIIVKFDITDDDNALVDSFVKILNDETGEVIKQDKINVGPNNHTFTDLATGKKYKIVVENNYSLKQDKQNVQKEVVKEEQIEITDVNNCDFRARNLNISKRVPVDTKVHISFENGVMSYKDVDSIKIDGVTYPVTKGNDNVYKLDIDPVKKGVNVIKIESVSIGDKEFIIDRNLSYTYENIIPTAENVSEISENTKDNLAVITFNLIDPDKSVKALKAYMRNSAGSIIAVSDEITEFSLDNINTFTMPLLKVNEYHIELKAITNIGDDQTFEEKTLFTKSKIAVSRATIVEQTIDKEYSNKEEEVVVTVKLNTNVDQEVRRIYIGEESYNIEKALDSKGNVIENVYKIHLISPMESGIFEQRITKVQIGTEFIDSDNVMYAEGVEPCAIKVLKDKPTLTHFGISADQSKTTFKLNDFDSALTSSHPEMVITDVTDNKVVCKKNLSKGGGEYEFNTKDIGITSFGHSYNVTVSVKYELKPSTNEKIGLFKKIGNFFANILALDEEETETEFVTSGEEVVYDDTFVFTEKATYNLYFKHQLEFCFLTTKKNDVNNYLRFDCSTGTNYKVEKVIINDVEYPVQVYKEREDFIEYEVSYRPSDVNLSSLEFSKVILENGVSLEIPEKDRFTTISVVQENPTFNILEYQEDIKENKVRFKFKLLDEDQKVAVDDLVITLMDSQNGIIGKKNVSKNDTMVEFDIPNPPTSVYKLKVTTSLYIIPGFTDYLETDWSAFEGEFNSSINTSILRSKFSTVYPRKNETFTIDYTISSTTVIKIDREDHTNQDKAVGITHLVINDKEYDVETLENEQYRVYYTADSDDGIRNLTVTEIKFSNGTTEKFTRTDTIDILKDAPNIKNYKVENKLAENKVKFIFDVEDIDGVIGTNAIYAQVGDQKENLQIGHNEIEFEVDTDKLLKFEVKASYDLDTDTLKNETTTDDNSYLDNTIFEKTFMLTADYGVSIDDIQTFNSKGEQTSFFEKDEDMTVKLTCNTKVAELYPETIDINDVVYTPKKDGNVYTIQMKAFNEAGKMRIPVKSITLNSGNAIDIKDKNISYEVMKDVLKVTELKYSIAENGDNINLNINVEDNDNSNKKTWVQVTDDTGNAISITKSTLEKGENKITFETNGSEKYFITVLSNYDRDSEAENGYNLHENVQIYYQIVSINTRYIEMKDIVDIQLFRHGDTGKSERVESLKVENLNVLDNCIVKVIMKDIKPFYSNITSYKIVDGKLKLIIEYSDAMVYTGEEELKPLEVTLDILENATDGFEYRGSFKSLVDDMRNNPSGTFTLYKDYDLSDYDRNIDDSESIIDFEFSGTINGNGHSINNLQKPLFNSLKDATVENITFYGSKPKKSSSTAIITKIGNHATLRNIHINVVICNYADNNGIYAYELNNNSLVENCSVTNLQMSLGVYGQWNSGGVRRLVKSTVRNCYVQGKISGGWHTNSGLVSSADSESEVYNNIVNITFTPYFGQDQYGNGAVVSAGNNATLRNNISLVLTGHACAIYNAKSSISNKSENNYQLEETSAVKNSGNGIITIPKQDINAELFKKLNFQEDVWNIPANTSIDNLPQLKSATVSYTDNGVKPSNSRVYIPDYGRVSKLSTYQADREIIYHNMYKLMPFFDAKEIIRDGNKIPKDNLLASKIVSYVLAYNKEGKLVTYLTTNDYNSLEKILIVFEDGSKVSYHVDFEDYYGNVASYMIAGLNVGYNYNKYIINADADIIKELIQVASTYTFDGDLAPLTTKVEDSRLYREHFNNVTKNKIPDFVIKTLVSMGYMPTFESDVLDNLIRQEFIETNALKQYLFAYNYFTYWYNLDMDGANVADTIMFFGQEMFDIGLTLPNLSKDLIAESNSVPNGTAGFYNNYIGGLTKKSNLGYFLDYYVLTLTHYTNGNDWFKENWKGGKYYTVSIDQEGVDYTLWDHLKKDSKVQNDFLPLCTVPENSTYAIASPTQAYFGSLRVYMTDPSDPAQNEAFEAKVQKWMQEVKAFYEFGYTYWGKDTLNKYCDVNYDMRYTYTGVGDQTVYNNPLTTEEPYHKYFIEAVNRWAGTSGGAYANGNEVFWVVIKMLDNFRVGTHETLHNQDSKIFLNGYGRRGNGEDYAAGFIQQYYRDGWVSPNIFDDEYQKENTTQNFYRATVETNDKLSVFYKNYFNVNDYLDWIEAKAFFELTADEQAKLVSQVSYPKAEPGHEEEGDDVVAYAPLAPDTVKAMNLKSMDALWDNRIMLRPGVTEYVEYSPGASTDSIFNIHWYQPHADNDRPDGANFKYLAWQMAGERGYYDGLCAYYSLKYIANKTNTDVNTTDLIALRYIMNDQSITFKKYKLDRYEKLSKYYDKKDNYIDAETIYNEYLEALKNDAKSGNRSLSYSTAVKRKYFRQIQTDTKDFTIDPFSVNPNAKAKTLSLDEDDLLLNTNSVNKISNSTNITNTVTNTVKNNLVENTNTANTNNTVSNNVENTNTVNNSVENNVVESSNTINENDTNQNTTNTAMQETTEEEKTKEIENTVNEN